MKPRRFPDLRGFLQDACTHASHHGRELPFLPFYVKEHPIGWLTPAFASELERWPHIFEAHGAWVKLKPESNAGRTEAMEEVTRALAREGLLHGWRDEPVSVSTHYAAPELMRVERAASRYFGFVCYGAHLNGFTRRGGTMHAWIARRSAGKAVDPGLLDNLVGGRIAAGFTVDETIRKEAWEEAGIAPAQLEGLYCAGAIRVEYTVPEGLHREILFVHDLWLPPEFVPANQDGEVQEIQLMRAEDVVERILAGEFTLDAGAVMIDAFLRQGIPAPEDPQYLELLHLLKP
jgi:8-oxo-dGTP pyrophosphatase MutT (NUDIX family)